MAIPLTQEHFDERLEEILLAVKAGFDDTASKADLAQMASKADLRRIEALMVTKGYLDEKIADLKGDLIVKLRKTNEKLDFIVSLLRAHAVFSDDDLKRIRTEFQIFPQLP